jgi:hypothetical protein
MRRFVLAGLLALLGVGVIAMTTNRSPEDAASAHASVERAANAASILRSPRTARDVMPSAVATSPLFEGMDIKPATSRRLERPDGSTAWIAEAADGKLCYMSGGSAGCAPATVLTERGLMPQIAWNRGVLRVEGIAADGVRALRVTFQDESVEEIPVDRGVFLLTTTKLPRHLEWTDSHGSQSLSVGLPSNLLEHE